MPPQWCQWPICARNLPTIGPSGIVWRALRYRVDRRLVRSKRLIDALKNGAQQLAAHMLTSTLSQLTGLLLIHLTLVCCVVIRLTGNIRADGWSKGKAAAASTAAILSIANSPV